MQAVKVYSVTELNNHINDLMKEDKVLSSVTVEGELSSYKVWPSGHAYFTIKDEGGIIDGIMYASRVERGLSFLPRVGDKVKIKGHIEVYVAKGQYKIYADTMSKAGAGELYAKYMELYNRLEEMGLFDEQYKKPIPDYVHTIGVVTASSGAVIHDIIRTSKELNPFVQIILYPAKVQGEDAPATLISGIRTLDEMGLDVIIVGRGGGSAEDLFCFNDENLAMTIFNAKTPIISAVGHEPDHSISDYVADASAATPTMAAEYVNFDFWGTYNSLQDYYDSLGQNMDRALEGYRDRLINYRNIFERYSPAARLKNDRLKLAGIKAELDNKITRRLSESKVVLEQYKVDVDNRMNNILSDRRARLGQYSAAIEASSPLKRISAGFAYVSGDSGRITSAASVKVDDEIRTVFNDGEVVSKVVSTKVSDSLLSDARSV